MYYTIEGKRLLKILYLIGILLGALMVNIGVQSGFFHSYDFLDYTSYISALEDNMTDGFFSYVVMIRIRQLLLFILGVFLLSPYVAYCIFTVLFSVTFGSFISLMVIRFGWMGMFYGMIFLIPQAFFYGIMLFAAYIYIFRSNPKEQLYRLRTGRHSSIFKSKPIIEYRVFVAALCVVMFCAGCYSEGYINPKILKMFLPM